MHESARVKYTKLERRKTAVLNMNDVVEVVNKSRTPLDAEWRHARSTPVVPTLGRAFRALRATIATGTLVLVVDAEVAQPRRKEGEGVCRLLIAVKAILWKIARSGSVSSTTEGSLSRRAEGRM